MQVSETPIFTNVRHVPSDLGWLTGMIVRIETQTVTEAAERRFPLEPGSGMGVVLHVERVCGSLQASIPLPLDYELTLAPDLD